MESSMTFNRDLSNNKLAQVPNVQSATYMGTLCVSFLFLVMLFVPFVSEFYTVFKSKLRFRTQQWTGFLITI
jgi:hypothetical protein